MVQANVSKKSRKRTRKIRNLCGRGGGIDPSASSKGKLYFYIAAASFVFFAVIFLGFYNGFDNSLKNFTNIYRSHYATLVRDKEDYCNPTLNIEDVFNKIHQNYYILHQDKALDQLKAAFEAANDFQNIALVGPVGVGKNLAAGALMEQFPWQKNVKAYSWNAYTYDTHEKFREINYYLDGISNCGLNLLVINKLRPSDKYVVEYINQLVFNSSDTMKSKRLIVLYVFSLNSMLTSAEYTADQRLLQDLPNTITVNFRGFVKEDLKDCIQRELLLENLSLSTTDLFDELVDTIDVGLSGCKNVNKKILAFNHRD